MNLKATYQGIMKAKKIKLTLLIIHFTLYIGYAQKPNFLIILADDLGYSDIGCYGSEIQTPNLDKLAAKGVKFTQFYNAARCCPSRASLLTGVYPHQAGMGEMVVNKPKNRTAESAYQGWLSKQTVTIAEVLKTAGYSTYLSGKWHVGEERQDWPLQRGFDRYFGLISGANSYYELLPNRLILKDNEPYTLPQNTYFTDAVSDHAVGFLQQNPQDKPFFLYLAYTAPHWPLQAPAEEIAKYRGKYRKGWDELRKVRFERQKQMDLLPKNLQLPERENGMIPWNEATNADEWDLRMATYAAMVTRMDKGIGQIVKQLEQSGQMDNTVIVFLSDNGACAEVLDGRAKRDLGDARYAAALNAPTGTPASYVAYDKNWAFVGNTPFRLYKQYTHEGGIATPMIVHYPRLIKKSFQTNQVGHLMDIMPTCLDLAGASYPLEYNQQKIRALEGKSLVPILKNKTRKPHDFLAWEHFDSRALRQGDWKIVWARHLKKWELYNLKTDRTETHNLADFNPQKLQEMIALYDQWAKKVGVEVRAKAGGGE